MEEILKQSISVRIPFLQCPDHQSQTILKGCKYPMCNRRTLLCEYCIREDPHMDHAQYIMDFQQFLPQFCQILENAAAQNKNSCQNFLKQKDNSDLFKSIYNDAKYIEAVTKTIEAQKYSIAQDITLLQEGILLEFQSIKDNLFKSLDTYLDQFKGLFLEFQNKFNQAFSLTQSFQYSNPSILMNKLTKEGRKAKFFLKKFKIQNQFFSYLKIKLDSNRHIDDLNMISTRLIAMSNSQPFYNTENTKELVTQQTENLRQQLLQRLKYQTPPQLVVRRNNTQPVEIQNINKQIFIQPQKAPSLPQQQVQDIQVCGNGMSVKLINMPKVSTTYKFKPLKKYPLDFPVSSIMQVASNAFTLTSKGDGRVFIFDRENRKVSTIDGHSESVIFQERIEVFNKPFNVLVTGAMDGKIIVWTVNKTNLQFEKNRVYQMSPSGVQCVIDIMNGGGFIAIDSEGWLGYYNPFQNEEIYPLNERVYGKNVRALLIKPNEQFLTYSISMEGTMVWKILDNRDILQIKTTNNIPSASSIIQHSFSNNLILSCLTGATVFNYDLRGQNKEARPGHEYEYLSIENTEGVQTILGIPINFGTASQIQIERKPNSLSNYDVRFYDFKLEALNSLESLYQYKKFQKQINQRARPRMRFYKENDNLYLITVNQKQKELFVYEAQLK